jgi:hypothetical protein
MAQLAAALAPGERERETERAATLLGSSPQETQRVVKHQEDNAMHTEPEHVSGVP